MMANRNSSGEDNVTQRNTVTGETDGDSSIDNEDSFGTNPLHESPRLKGYITLLSSAVFNYISADKQSMTVEDRSIDWCLAQYDMSMLIEDPSPNQARIRYSKAAAVITIIIACAVIFIHFISITELGNKLWSDMFGKNGKVELYISAFLTILWIITTYCNTTIRGPAGCGKGQYNLYFSTWICCFTSFWILEGWSTATGRASFERFVRSWPNRCPMWIVTLILAATDFCFVLDASKNWEDGLNGYPYTRTYFSHVRNGEWVLLIVVTIITFACSVWWVFAEILRENKTNRTNTKSDQENHVEGIMLHILTAIWVPTVFIVTVPGGAASLLGNMYFTTWGCSFSVVGTLIWWQRTWREGIFKMIKELQNEYDKAKRVIRRREDKRLAVIKEQDGEDNVENIDEEHSAIPTNRQDGTEQSENRSTDDICIVDDDYSISSTDYLPRLNSDDS